MRVSVLLVLALSVGPVWAQESQLQADFRHEGEHVKESCGDPGRKTIATCPIELATDWPLHIALGNLAPQNGFGFGAAFVEHYTPNEQWRLSWNADGVRALGGSWRAGAYMKIVHIPRATIGVVSSPGTASSINTVARREYPVMSVYTETTSLEKLFFSGLGSATTKSGKSVFGMRQTIVGANAILPIEKPVVARQLRVSLLGGVNGRLITLRGNRSESVPTKARKYVSACPKGVTAASEIGTAK